MRPSAAVVICTYAESRLTLLDAAISAAQRELRPGDELVVVVDHNDELLCRLRARPGLATTFNREQRGLSGARNSGVAASAAEVVVFLDDDAVPRAGWLDQLLTPFSDADVVGVGGAVHARWETVRPTWWPPELDWVVGCSYAGQQLGTVRNPIGANMAFRRAAVVAAGGFRAGLGRVGVTPLGCEETELGLRLRSLGLGRCVVVGDAAVDHFVPAERATLRYLTKRCFSEGISKAVVRHHAAQLTFDRATSTLAPERRYLRSLATGMGRSVRRASTSRHPTAAGAAFAIPIGLACAVAGFARGTQVMRAG
jgi:glycosyltransferase involved in cell wall biosynthesis